MSFCKDCFKGVTHEGSPEGKLETIAGVECYVGTPTVDYPRDKVVLYLADAFGLPLVNNQLLVDDFARNGFKTVLPDIHEGDAVPADAMASGTFDVPAWFAKHPPTAARAIIDKVVAALKAEGVQSFAAVGYCYGGRCVFDLAFDNVISVAAAAHPSLLKIPEDLEKYITSSKAPLFLATCPTDTQFPPAAQAAADALFNDKEAGFAPGYKREYFEGCKHGFAVRGDMSDPLVKAGKEGAFRGTVEWFHRYL